MSSWKVRLLLSHKASLLQYCKGAITSKIKHAIKLAVRLKTYFITAATTSNCDKTCKTCTTVVKSCFMFIAAACCSCNRFKFYCSCDPSLKCVCCKSSRSCSPGFCSRSAGRGNPFPSPHPRWRAASRRLPPFLTIEHFLPLIFLCTLPFLNAFSGPAGERCMHWYM